MGSKEYEDEFDRELAKEKKVLESRVLRLASPLFHLGAFGVIVGHAMGLLVPASLTAPAVIGPLRLPWVPAP